MIGNIARYKNAVFGKFGKSFANYFEKTENAIFTLCDSRTCKIDLKVPKTANFLFFEIRKLNWSHISKETKKTHFWPNLTSFEVWALKTTLIVIS